MQILALAALLALPQAPPAQLPALAAPAPVAAPVSAPEASLSFYSESFPFAWDRMIPLTVNLDGLKVNSIFFNLREPATKFLKGATFGTRAQVEVTNTGKTTRVAGFAVAVLDEEGRLLGAATGGAKVSGVKPGETETFDLNFTQVKERIPKGAVYLLTVELR